MSETLIKKDTCFYCGEAPVNHQLYRLNNFISSMLDSHMVMVTNYAPKFIRNFADRIPVSLFNILKIFNLAYFSSDIEKANSFRSRVIWEEAERRGIQMEQVVLFKKPLDWYRAKVQNKTIYFESIPIPPKFLDFKKDWDNKIVLKKELLKYGIPVPQHAEIPLFPLESLDKIFKKFKTSVIVKPKLGSRGRHTVTNINNLEHFKKGVATARQISWHLVVEDHLQGHICRATLVNGTLAGFYRASVPHIVGDGKQTIKQLIEEKDSKRVEREHVRMNQELLDHISRSGFTVNHILPNGVSLSLSHRSGRLFGGNTKEMIDELHPSFIPILEKAARIVELAVVGFDCIIPDPTKDANTQRWGIIECNTLPFIDMHYFALEGKPRNIAGMIWDMWQ